MNKRQVHLIILDGLCVDGCELLDRRQILRSSTLPTVSTPLGLSCLMGFQWLAPFVHIKKEKMLMETQMVDTDDGIGELLRLAQGKGLVVLAGAGISMAPPTSLPSWWDFNTAVLRALADRLEATSSRGWVGERFEILIERRKSLQAFTPDFMAQLMAEEVGIDYFRVLQGLDTDCCNANHHALADLANARILRAIITTNFDRLVEIALTARGVEHRVFATTQDFKLLPDALDQLDAPLPVIKVHGTVTDLSSMVDTLAQRVAGRPESLEAAIRTLLLRSPCLVLGFSGADLAYDPDYLALRPTAADGVRLNVLRLPDKEPLPSMQKLVKTWGIPRGSFITGELPAWLLSFCARLVATPSKSSSEASPTAAPPAADRWSNIMAARCRAWVDSLGTVPALNMFTSLVDTNADDEQMLRFLMFFRRYYRTTEDAMAPTYWRFEYNLGRRLLDRGLIGNIHPRDAGIVLEGFRDIEAADYIDATQFLARSADPQLGGMIEGEVDLIRLMALKLGHGHVSGNVNALIKTLPEAVHDRRKLEICSLAAEFAEEFGQLDAAKLYVQTAYEIARRFGDEPRRGSIAARAARIAALKKEYDDSEWLAEEALQVSSRLSLPVLRGDALAARGMLDVLRSRDRDAVAPLNEARAIFFQLARRPRLLYALCDLARAYYYSQAVDPANDALCEARQLSALLPGLQVPVLLVQMELLRHAEQWDNARTAADELLIVATELRHEFGIERAGRTLKLLAARATNGSTSD